jgi:hypothetical protein
MAVRGGSGDGNEPVAAAAAILHLLRGKPTKRAVENVMKRIEEIQGPHQMDRLLEAVLQERKLDGERLAALARWLCEHGRKRETVKAGLALLGVSGSQEDVDLITRLGLIEELTLYSLVALTNVLTEPEQAIFDLTRQVEGWGRIHGVKRLADSTNPVVHAWLIRGGAENTIMTEEIAFVAASTGRLAEALEGEVDESLLDHAGELLSALATGGPADDMSDYADGARAIASYLRHVAPARRTLDRLSVLTTLEYYLDRSAAENSNMSTERRESLLTELREVLSDQAWRDVVAAKLSSPDLEDVKSALGQAKRLALDRERHIREWLSLKPDDSYLWQELIAAASIEDVIEFAERLLPLKALAGGPTDDLGLGLGYEVDNSLGMVLQGMCQTATPGRGWRLVASALNNRVTRNRNLATRALAGWPHEDWPLEATQVLRDAHWREPNEDAKKRMRDLLTAHGGI